MLCKWRQSICICEQFVSFPATAPSRDAFARSEGSGAAQNAIILENFNGFPQTPDIELAVDGFLTRQQDG
ncbi:hypothetical protein MPC1_6970002 [Methylocella tundrae]|nr:hypothetical protein MPC1_6970002 [Methylocella tundrae]